MAVVAIINGTVSRETVGETTATMKFTIAMTIIVDVNMVGFNNTEAIIVDVITNSSLNIF